MSSEGFAVLQAEFETILNRLKEATDVSEKHVLLREMRQIIVAMDRLIERRKHSRESPATVSSHT